MVKHLGDSESSDSEDMSDCQEDELIMSEDGDDVEHMKEELKYVVAS